MKRPKRPRDANQNAVQIGMMAVGEIPKDYEDPGPSPLMDLVEAGKELPKSRPGKLR